MDTFGNDLSSGGVVLSRDELIKKRERNGECPTCGQKCYKKKLFKLEPITVAGKVLKGRCLVCNPQDPNKEELVACVAVAAPPPSSKGRGGSRRGASSSRNLRSSKTKNTASRGSGRAGGLASSLPPSDVGTDFRASGKEKSKLKPIMSEPFGLKSNDCIDEEEEASNSRRQNANNGGGPNRRSSLDKHDSARMGEFLRRKSPRPSETFLDGIDVSKLNVDDDDDDEHDNNNSNTNSSSKSSGGNKWGSAKSAVSRLTREERQALHTLNSNDNSFLDIVNIMMMNSMSTHVQAEGLHALSLVHDLDVNMLDECANNCGFEVIISSMGKCFKDAVAQTNACKVLFMAAATAESAQLAIGHAGGIEACVDSMKEYEDDDIVMEGCLLALSNLCIPEDNIPYALEGDLIELGVNAMSKNVENCGLQEHGCAVLANLAVHEEARGRIRECGGCDNIVVSMIVNPMDSGVQCQALVALRNLCVKDDENKVLLANAGAIDAIIQAMQNHRDDVCVQARACWVLSILGINVDNKIYICENGGAEMIVRSMWDYADDLGVQEKACRSLWTLSVHPQNRDSIMEVDGIPAIITAMKNHAGEPDIQERGCGVLCNLAANDDDIKIQIVDDGALEAVVMAMVLHGENENVQEWAVNVLYKLCIPDNIEKMIEANVSPMMAVVAESFPSTQEKASYVLEQTAG